MKIQESAEMYLETILVLLKRKGSARMVDVAGELGYAKPSVSVFLKGLRTDGYITTDENGILGLTDSGREIAERIYERHRFITKFLVAIGVNEETAAADACKMEHIISDETYAHMKAHYARYEQK